MTEKQTAEELIKKYSYRADQFPKDREVVGVDCALEGIRLAHNKGYNSGFEEAVKRGGKLITKAIEDERKKIYAELDESQIKKTDFFHKEIQNAIKKAREDELKKCGKIMVFTEKRLRKANEEKIEDARRSVAENIFQNIANMNIGIKQIEISFENYRGLKKYFVLKESEKK